VDFGVVPRCGLRTVVNMSGRREVVVLGSARTALGCFNGALAGVPGVGLASAAITAAIERSRLPSPALVEECILGNVVSAGVGQAPARQAALLAGLHPSTTCTTINKVCASGLKAVSLAASSILLGSAEVVVAGGFESMSQAPYYLPKARTGYKFGDATLVDGLTYDGLRDARSGVAMGVFGERCAKEFGFSRAEQDAYALSSYDRAIEASRNGAFTREIVAVNSVAQDEQPSKLRREKVANLRPVFEPEDGTITAANSSPISDGAAALVLASSDKALDLGLTPLATVVSFADAEQAPEDFTTTPAVAIRKALQQASLAISDIDYFEINEAFAAVAMANAKLLQLDPARVNVFGGAVALGHPLGCSGARIVVTLLNVLQTRGAKTGCAAICNGGGGASAIILRCP